MRLAARAAAFATLFGVGATATAAGAERANVVLAREGGHDEALERIELRLAAELRAAGFRVEGRDVDGALDARRAIEEGVVGEKGAEGAERPFATVLLRRAPLGAATDIWVADHVTRKTVVRRIDAGRGEASEGLLAMRVVELMRASLTEPLPAPAPPPQALPPPSAAHTATADAAPPTAARFELGAGLAALYSAGFGPAWGPTLHASFAPFAPPALCAACRLGLLVAGPTFGPRVEASEGSATLRQELALVEASLILTREGWARPFLGVGAGAYHLHARGAARAPFLDGRDDAWAALASLGAGARLYLSPTITTSLTARALAPFPRPVLDFAGNHVAALGRPSWLFTLSLDTNLGGT